MSHTIRRSLALLAAMLVLLGTFATAAYANLDDEPADNIHGASASNPGAGPDFWWRQGWGRSLHPDLALEPPTGMDYKKDGYIIGMLYSVDRLDSFCVSGTASDVIIDRAFPDDYDRSSFGGVTGNGGPFGTNSENTIDLLGVYLNRLASGIVDPSIEGQWFLHYRYFSTLRYSETVHTVALGIDTTPPEPVTGLTVSTGVGSPAVTTWQPATRARVSWNPAEYDALSGVGYYEVLIDDKPLIPETASGATPTQGRVYSAPWLPTPSTITVEDMPPGEHKISVVCVDRATNKSVAASRTFYSDPDTPTIAFTRPTNGLIKESLFISVDASDSAGPPVVNFKLDGVDVATIAAPPYQFKPDLSAVLPGSHLLEATVTDMLGRSVTTSMTVSTLAATVVPLDGLISSDDPSLNSGISALSETHPNDPMDAAVFWRQSWGNSLHPSFAVTPSTPDPASFGFVGGMLYSVDRTANSVIDPSRPADYYRTAKGTSTTLDETIDLFGIYGYPPIGGWPLSTLGGESSEIEGMWYFHYRPFTSSGYTGLDTYTVPIGVDVTKPMPVTGLHASPSSDVNAGGVWTSATRAHITWNADRYDDLSGVAYYQVLIDGKPVVGDPDTPDQGRVYEVSGRTPSSITIENVPAGAHEFSVVAVDRATNESTPTSVMFYSDPAGPTIAFNSPGNGNSISDRTTISIDAEDDAGSPPVTVTLGGVPLATFASGPYEFKPNLTGVAPGTYELKATATDHMGRSAVATLSVTVGSSVAVGDGMIVTDDPTFNAALTGTTSTHPNSPTDPDAFWRQGWGNSLHPEFNVAPPSADPVQFGFVTGMLYSVSRNVGATIDPTKPGSYFKSSRSGGTNLDQTVDLMGVFNFPPAGGWPASSVSGVTQPYEGLWSFNFLPFTTMAYVPEHTYGVTFGVDVTRPRPVTGIKASPVVDAANTNAWTSTTRVHVTWDASRYDDLSGVGYYKLLIDDKAVIPDGTSSTQGRVYEVYGRTPTSVTLENITPGRHKISIIAVDRATNESVASDTYFGSDPDLPTVAFLTPVSSIIQMQPTLTASATDAGGIKSVVYAMDGEVIGSSAVAPYSVTPNVSGFAAGPHVLSVTVTDMLGRTASATKAVTLDKTPVKVSSFSRNYALFYPIKRDRYYDNLTVKYKLNKAATVTLTIRDSAGKVRKTMTATKGAGSHSFVWNGKWSTGKVYTGKYTLQISAVDSAAYTSTTGKLSTSIRNYQLVKTSTNRVRVVPR